MPKGQFWEPQIEAKRNAIKDKTRNKKVHHKECQNDNTKNTKMTQQ